MPPSDFQKAREQAQEEQHNNDHGDHGNNKFRTVSRRRRRRPAVMVQVEGYPYLPTTVVKLSRDDFHKAAATNANKNNATPQRVLGAVIARILGLLHDDDDDDDDKNNNDDDDDKDEDEDNQQQQYGQLVVEFVEGGSTNTLFKVWGIHSAFSPSVYHPKNNGMNRFVSSVDVDVDEDDDATRSSKIPDAVLVRLFGAEGMIDRDVETSTFVALAQAGIAPPYYGAFVNGRLEGWMEGMRPLQAHELSQPDIARGIAASLAQLHYGFAMPQHYYYYDSSLSSLQQPSEEPVSDDKEDEPSQDQETTVAVSAAAAAAPPILWKQLSEWYQKAMVAVKQETFTTQRDYERAVVALDLESGFVPRELEWLKSSVIPLQQAAIRLCHNDVLAANVLYNDLVDDDDDDNDIAEVTGHDATTTTSSCCSNRDKKDEKNRIQLIDFEYGGCNYASFDIANHWNEYADGPPRVTVPNYDWFPTLAQQESFCQTYLDTARSILESSKSAAAALDAEREHPDDDDDAEPRCNGHDYSSALLWKEQQLPTLEDLLQEVHGFVMVNHIYWGLWAINQGANEGCHNYDYLEYAQNRFRQYWVCKQQYQQKQQQQQQQQQDSGQSKNSSGSS
ncbi:hypothetical protein ACA910_019278 [Epithemia clementina (nom. ined.)]